MAKVETVILKELELVETEEGYEKKYHNERRVPASITNYSLAVGESMGLIESSQITDLADIQELFEAAINPKSDRSAALANLDVTKMNKVIYLAIVGMNNHIDLTYEEFLHLYHEDVTTTIDTYTNLVLATLTEGINKFAEGFEKSTKKKQIKKHQNHQK